MWFLKLAALSALIATAPQPPDEAPKPDDEKILNEIIIETDQLSPDIEREGTLLLRPMLTPRKKRDPLTRTRRIDFVFSPVVIDETGTAIAYTEAGRDRFVSSMRVPNGIDTPFPTNFLPKTPASAYTAQSINVPGGTYVLSEIVYTFAETVTLGDPAGRSGTPFRVQEEFDSVRFCLSE